MCIYQRGGPLQACDHAECQIILTVKKINRQVFKPRKVKSERKMQEESLNNLEESESGSGA